MSRKNIKFADREGRKKPGIGQNAKGKETLFKCLPEKGVNAELYWENKTTRMLMLHRFSDDADELTPEVYYLHVEPK